MPYSSPDVPQAVRKETADVDVAASMLLGAGLESGWDPNAVGDQGHSFGAFQINLPAHPNVTQAQALNPYWSADYMYGPYVSGVAAQDTTGLWLKNPELAAEKAAMLAERPAQDYLTTAGQAKVDYWWNRTLAELKALGYDTSLLGPPRPGGGGTDGGGGTTSGGGGTTGDGSSGSGGTTSLPPLTSACQAIVDEALKHAHDSYFPLTALEKAWDAAGCPRSLDDYLLASGQVTSGPTNPVTPLVDAVKNPIKGIEDALKFLFSYRGLEVLGGGLLILIGLSALSKSLGGPTIGGVVQTVKP